MTELFWATYAAWLASELWILRRDRAPASGAHRDAGSRTVLVGATISGIALAFILARVHWAAMPWPRDQAIPVGVTLMLAGIAFRWWAVRTLGAHFRTQVTLLDAHRLIRTGPYARIRHPAYAGALVTCLGLGIALANWLSLLAMLVVPLVGVIRRVRVEERALGERFGADWLSHRADTWAMLPPLW